MNLKSRIILEDYRKQRDDFVKLGDIVHDMLREMVDAAGMRILGVEHRVKSEKSLAGKLGRTGDRFQEFDDLIDILGARVICFFADEVDAVGKLVEETFDIDRQASSDKRALLNADAFGYLSLHYICSLPLDAGYSRELCKKRFEIQIRTNLQHTWSEIEHDLGYKSEFGVPRVVIRRFARIAGLLELADDEFVRVRDKMKRYTEDIRQRIIDDCADDVSIDMISLSEYVRRNKSMREMLSELADISGAEISEVDADGYIEQLAWLGVKTLGDLRELMERNRETALKLARSTLKNSELDILSSNAGLMYLCRAELVSGYSEEQAAKFLALSLGDEDRAKRRAKRLYSSYQKMKAGA